DVLDGMQELKLCVGYDIDGERTDMLPAGADDCARCKPMYETLAGWSESTVGIKRLEALPRNARAYLDRVEAACGVPIDVISTGPDREETIVRRHPYL